MCGFHSQCVACRQLWASGQQPSGGCRGLLGLPLPLNAEKRDSLQNLSPALALQIGFLRWEDHWAAMRDSPPKYADPMPFHWGLETAVRWLAS